MLYLNNWVFEKRRFGRRTTWKSAKIIQPDGQELACTVVDISEGGARLQFAAGLAVPDSFDLLIEVDDMVVTCRLAHRTDATAGVEFTRSPRVASRTDTTRTTDARRIARSILSKKP